MNSSFTKKYKVLEKIGEGSFSDVLKCQNRETESMYAAKRLKKTYRSMQEVYDCPEIIAMRKVSNHPNILHIIETHYDQFPGKVTLIFELMDMSVYDFIKTRKRCLLENKVKNFTFQLLKGLEHLHKSGIFHRDLKPENILIKSQSSEGTRNFFSPKNEIIKIGDLGSIRGIYSKPPYTEYISTRWYRSPECLLTNGFYGPKMDVWAVGCVFYELLTLKPLFPGSNELDQINKIHNILGTPSSRVLNKFKKHKSRNCEYFFPSYDGSGFTVLIPTVSDPGRDILKQMLTYDPDHRANVRRLLEHRYFLDYRDLDDHAKRRRSQSETPPVNKSPFTGDWRVPLYYNYLSPEAKQKRAKNQGMFMDINSERELKITNFQNSGKTKFKSKSGSLNVLKPDSKQKNSIATQIKTLPELIKVKSVGKNSHKSLHASVAKVELKTAVQSKLNTLKSYAKTNANKLSLQSMNDSKGSQLKTSSYVLHYKTKKVSDPNTVDKTLPSSGGNKYLSKSFVLPRRSSGKSTLEPINEVSEQINSLRSSAAKQRSVSRQEELVSLKFRPPARKNTRTKLLPPLNKSLIQKKSIG